MFLGRYDYDGDPDALLPAYDRLVAGMPAGQIAFHACVVREGGITVYDACPSPAVFASFSSDPDVLGAMAAVGLPAPRVTPLGEVHHAQTTAGPVIG